ncbi:MAG TPA: hypothetical protein VFU55_01220 [Terracidiphilus sp.]|nr:hypothetical protein [Terracidiphilus sp.]
MRNSGWMKGAVIAVAALALGLWLGNARAARASNYANDGGLQFQLAGVSEHSSLLVYQPGTRTVYVYQAATTGSSYIGCSYMFHVGRPGEAIQRENCAVTTMR